MSRTLRSARGGAPIKLIALVLLTVLAPSVLVTALGLVAVIEANSYVSDAFRRPYREKVERLRGRLDEAWTERLQAYATYLRAASGELEAVIPRLAATDASVRGAALIVGDEVRGVSLDRPRVLVPQNGTSAELAEVYDLAWRRGDERAALGELRRVIAGTDREDILVEALPLASRLSYRLGELEAALDALRWAHARFGNTVDEMGVVRAVPLLLRQAEIESESTPAVPPVATLRRVAEAIRDNAPFMERDRVEFFAAQLMRLSPSAIAPVIEGVLAARPVRDGPLSGDVVTAIAPQLRSGTQDGLDVEWRFVTPVHGGAGALDFAVWYGGENREIPCLLLDREALRREVDAHAAAVGLASEGIQLVRRRDASLDSDAWFVEAPAPDPLRAYELVFSPPAGEIPREFRGFNVISLAAFTWAVILAVLGIFVGVGFALRAVANEVRTARIKTDFVSFVTHELKTPLTAIRMFSDTILEGRLESEDEQREYIARIDRETERLSSLIDQILEYSKVERRQKQFQFVPCDMLQIVREAIDIFHDHYQDDPREVEVNSAQHISRIKMDRAAMTELVLNLLSNAAKYSPSDERIIVNLSESVSEISVEVVDRGVGIRKRDQKKIFDRFYRADDYLTREVDGTGLGLTFSRYIAKVHNGDIKVASQRGGGSSFTLVLRKTHVLAD